MSAGTLLAMLRRNSDQVVLGLRRAQGQELILGHTCPFERWEGRHSQSPLSSPEYDCEGQGTKGLVWPPGEAGTYKIAKSQGAILILDSRPGNSF